VGTAVIVADGPADLLSDLGVRWLLTADEL
jgi:hypothetical protein